MSHDLPAPVQGWDSITIDAPIHRIWQLVDDSAALVSWGPPVISVEVHDHPERVGSRRTVRAKLGRREGEFGERRIIHDSPQAMAFVIETETFGISRVIRDAGSLMQLESTPEGGTRLTWSFFHRPNGVLGRLLNQAIRRRQRRNRLLALASLKAFVEDGVRRPAP